MYFAPYKSAWLRAWFCQNCVCNQDSLLWRPFGLEMHYNVEIFFYKSPLGGPVSIFGGKSWAATPLVLLILYIQ